MDRKSRSGGSVTARVFFAFGIGTRFESSALSEPAFRRRTTARRHRARAPDEPSGLPRRRADRQPRSRNQRASLRSDARMSQEERTDLGHRHAQPGARESMTEVSPL